MSHAPRKVSSRNSNKENKPRQSLNVPRLNHCKIDMTKEALISSTCSFGRKTSVHVASKTSLEKLQHDSSGLGRQALTKSSAKLSRPKEPWFPATTKNSQKSLPKKDNFKSQISLRGILNNSLIEISKLHYRDIYKTLDGQLSDFENQASLNDRQTIGFIRLIIDKIHEKSDEYEKEHQEALEQAQQMSTLFKEELKRKNKELLWLKQQVESRTQQTALIERQVTPSQRSSISDYSAGSYLAEHTLPCKTLDDDLKTKLKLDFNKIKEYRQSEEYLHNISD